MAGRDLWRRRAGVRISPSALFLIDRMIENPDYESSKAILQRHFEAFPDVERTGAQEFLGTSPECGFSETVAYQHCCDLTSLVEVVMDGFAIWQAND